MVVNHPQQIDTVVAHNRDQGAPQAIIDCRAGARAKAHARVNVQLALPDEERVLQVARIPGNMAKGVFHIESKKPSTTP